MPIEKEEVTQLVNELLESKDKPNKFFELLTCRRTLSVLGVILVVVAKHYGVSISDDEMLSVAGVVSSLVLGHSLRKPNN